MLVATVLEGKGTLVATVERTASVDQVVADLNRHQVGALVVSPDGERIEGIVSEWDIVRRLSTLHGGLLDEPVLRSCRPRSISAGRRTTSSR